MSESCPSHVRVIFESFSSRVRLISESCLSHVRVMSESGWPAAPSISIHVIPSHIRVASVWRGARLRRCSRPCTRRAASSARQTPPAGRSPPAPGPAPHARTHLPRPKPRRHRPAGSPARPAQLRLDRPGLLTRARGEGRLGGGGHRVADRRGELRQPARPAVRNGPADRQQVADPTIT